MILDLSFEAHNKILFQVLVDPKDNHNALTEAVERLRKAHHAPHYRKVMEELGKALIEESKHEKFYGIAHE